MIYKSITLRIHDIFTRNTCHGRQVKLFHFSKIPTHQAFSEGILKQMLSFRPLHSLSYSPIWLKSPPPPSPTFPTFHRCYQNPPFNRQRFDFQFFDIPTYASLGGGEEGVDLSSVVSNQFVFETGEGIEEDSRERRDTDTKL